MLDTERWSGQAHADEDCMVGDVNLFLTDTEDPTLGEIEIMIAGQVLLPSLGLSPWLKPAADRCYVQHLCILIALPWLFTPDQHPLLVWVAVFSKKYPAWLICLS